MSEIPVAGVRAVYDLEFNNDGTKLFVASRTRTDSADSDNLFRYDLTTPYDTVSYTHLTLPTNDQV